MDTFQLNTYGERIASIYDDLYADYDPAAITARGGHRHRLHCVTIAAIPA